MREYVVTWRIEKISFSWHRTGCSLRSPKFLAGPIRNSAWTLRLYPRGYENSDYFSLFLRREKDDVPENLAVNFELCCLSANSSVLKSFFHQETFHFFQKEDKEQPQQYGDLRFLSRIEVFGPRSSLYLLKDTLTLRCRMWKHEGIDKFHHFFACTRLNVEEKKSSEKIKFDKSGSKKDHIENIIFEKLRNGLIAINLSFHEDMLDVKISENQKLRRFTTLNLSFVNEIHEETFRRKFVWFNGPQNEAFRLHFSGILKNKESDNLKEIEFEIIYEAAYATKEIVENIRPYVSVNGTPKCAISCNSGELLNYPSISEVLWNLYEGKNLCDLELKSGGRSLFVHKIVLCARSEVFYNMLSTEMKEKKDNLIEIKEISAATLEKFLSYLYTDAIENLEWDAVIELYYAADKYQVKGLKRLCSTYLMKYAHVDERIKVVKKLAGQYSDEELKSEVKNFRHRIERKKVFGSSRREKGATQKTHPTVNSKLSTSEEKENQNPKKKRNDISKEPTFLDDFRSYYKKAIGDEIGCDILVKTKRASYPAFKTVLCANSSYFKNKLYHDSVYIPTHSIEIEELEDHDTVSTMLFFMHTDLLEDVQWDTAKKLYYASDVYNINKLKLRCSHYLLENLQVSNACDLLLLAHEHRDDKLKSAVTDYIGAFEEDIFASDEWAKLTQSNLLLAYETMSAKYRKKD